MSGVPRLTLTDGTTQVDLINHGASGWHLERWQPANVQQIIQSISSPLVDGAYPVSSRRDDVADEFVFALSHGNVNSVIQLRRRLVALLNKAVAYWTSDWQDAPVWLEAKGSAEAERRYAVIKGWALSPDNDPYGVNVNNDIMQPSEVELTLSLVHGFWQNVPPGQVQALTFDSFESFGRWREPFEPAVSGDVINVDRYGGTAVIGQQAGAFGKDGAGNVLDMGVIFRNVDIPQGKPVLYAYVRCTAATNQAGVNVVASLNFEATNNPKPYSDYASWNGRTYTAFPVTWTISGAWTAGTTYVSPNIMFPLIRVTFLPNWQRGGNVALRFYTTPASTAVGAYREPAALSHALYGSMELVVAYEDEEEPAGVKEVTCAAEVQHYKPAIYANYSSTMALTHVFVYDASAGTYSDNLLEGPPGYDLWPSGGVGVGDCSYYGVDSTLYPYGTFMNIVFDIEQTMGNSVQLEYWNGAVWQFPSTAGYSALQFGSRTEGGTYGFCEITPPDWATTTINGVTGYWLRRRITAVSAALPVESQSADHHVYTCSWGQVGISAANIGGDLPALVRSKHENLSENSTWPGNASSVRRIIMGLRSRSRGDKFSAYLGTQNLPFGVLFGAIAGSTSYVADVRVPYGRKARYSPGGAVANTSVWRWYWVDWPNTVFNASQYFGRYRAFVRYKQTAGNDGDFTMRLAVSQGRGVDEVVYDPAPTKVSVTSWMPLDLGIITLPTYQGHAGDHLGSMHIELQMQAMAAGTVDIADLILIPADEAFIDTFEQDDLYGSDELPLTQDYLLDLDSATHPKHFLRSRVLHQLEADDLWWGSDYYEQMESAWTSVGGQHMLQAQSDQKLWIFCMSVGDTLSALLEDASAPFESCNSICLYGVQRYQSQRGDS